MGYMERERERESKNLGENAGWIYLAVNRSHRKLKNCLKIGKTKNKPKGREVKTNGADYYIFFAVKVRDCDLIETTLHQIYASWNAVEKAGGEEWFEIMKNGRGWENCLLFLFSRAYDVEIYDHEHCEIVAEVLSRDTTKKSSYLKLRKDETKHEVFKKLDDFMKKNGVYCKLFHSPKWQLFDTQQNQTNNQK